MLLAADIGNTNVKFALYDGKAQRALWRCASDRRRTADEYATFLGQCLAQQRVIPDKLSAAAAVSVVPEVSPLVLAAMERLTGHWPLVAGDPGLPLPVECLVDRPEDAGRDRLVAVVAARARHAAPLLIIDFGTATTFTVVDGKGRYCGGAIAPGVNISRKALYDAASRLPPVELAGPPTIQARNTVHAMQSGIYFGTISMVEGMISRLGAADPFASVISSGGLSRVFDGAIAGVTATEPDLTLVGLQMLCQAQFQGACA